jgi:hypothetical protein
MEGRVRKKEQSNVKTALNKSDKNAYYYIILNCNCAVVRDEFDHGAGYGKPKLHIRWQETCANPGVLL